MDHHRQLKSKVTKFHYADNSINSLQCQCETSKRTVEVRSLNQMIVYPGRAVTSQRRKASQASRRIRAPPPLPERTSSEWVLWIVSARVAAWNPAHEDFGCVRKCRGYNTKNRIYYEFWLNLHAKICSHTLFANTSWRAFRRNFGAAAFARWIWWASFTIAFQLCQMQLLV